MAPGAACAGAALPWMLQVGYFAEHGNAQGLRQRLVDLGLDARVLPAHDGDRFRVVVGDAAASPEALRPLQAEVEARAGIEGFLTQAPDDATADEASAPAVEPAPAVAVRTVAQVPPPQGGESIASGSPPSYGGGLFRSPQEDIESIPGFTAGGLQFIPTLGLAIGYDDNVTASPRNEVSSWYYMISPAIRAELPTDHSVLALVLAYDWVRYDDSPIDDYELGRLRGEWTWDISQRQDINVFGQYSEGQDARGTGRRQGPDANLPFQPDEWERFDLGGVWDYGAVGSRGRLSIQAGLADLEYTNNREGDFPGLDGTTALDRDWWYLGGTFFWRVAPKTSLLARLTHSEISYKESTSLDSDEDSFLLGVSWDATARTTGMLSYGKLKKRFNDPARSDYDGPAWLASLTWRPRTYSAFTLTGSRRTNETDGRGDYVLRQELTLSWMHDWATRFGTVIDVGFGEDEVRPNGREDDLFYWGLGARYTFNSHFRFGASVQGMDRDSDRPGFDYDRLVYLLTMEATF